MHLSGRHLSEVSFPVGGIGAGCVGLDGGAYFRDWEIFNRPGKGRMNGCTHFAVRAEKDGQVIDFRILHGPWTRDLSGSGSGFGLGPDADTLCGFPHFGKCEFDGEFPCGTWHFEEKKFPAAISFDAWSPFVPGESDLSSMPCAVFDLELKNTAAAPLDYTCIGVLNNPWRGENCSNRIERNGRLTHLVLRNNEPEDGTDFGELALTCDAQDVSFQEYLFRGDWCDRRDVYLFDLTTPGHFVNRRYETGGGGDPGLVAVHFRLEPGESRRIPFVLSWYLPNRKNTWDDPERLAKRLALDGIGENRWKNYYASLCRSASDAAAVIFRDYRRIRTKVFTFRETLHRSTLPPAVLEGAAENLAVLVSATCLRLEDGTFWGWEGVHPDSGSCMGSCQHVWNYAQALSLLFPDLERSLRESQFRYNFDEEGVFHFRLPLPLGLRARPDGTHACADGAFGEVMKTFREWKISGDTRWLRRWFPCVRRIIEFAWSPDNADAWDPEKTGLLSGRQHHTLDMELYGPSGWLEGHYLGALKAAAEMAEACGDASFAEECRAVFAKGRAAAEAELFNGEYYIQKIDLDDQSVLTCFPDNAAAGDSCPYWDPEHGEIKYQFGGGCSIDSHLGQWYASLYGIGEILDPERVRSTLRAIFKYNFRETMADHANTWRVFALNEEAGTLICSWPAGVRKPVIPLPYHSETMTGFEWAAACHLVMSGEREAGERMAAAIRDRYDGSNRNPWNEIECGSNYARSMAAYAMLQAYSGFRYDMTKGSIGFRPIVEGDFRCFWSLGSVWGEYVRSGGTEEIRILSGEAEFREIGVSGTRGTKNHEAIAWPCRVQAGDILRFE